MFPLGPFFSRNITIKMGQAPARHFMPHLYNMIINEEIDPTKIITHRLGLEDAPHAYTIFNNKEDNCVKVVLKP